MKKIRPYKTVRGAMSALDNGGRFYNLFSAKSDGTISGGELAKAAGSISANGNAILYFEMALSVLAEHDRQTVRDHLSDGLKRHWRSHRPLEISPVAVEQLEEMGQLVITDCHLRYVKDVDHFSGFISIPVGQTMTMVPVHEHFSLYEAYEGAGFRGPCCIVAAAKEKTDLEGVSLRIGGVMRQLNSDDKRFFLEAVYYCDCD